MKYKQELKKRLKGVSDELIDEIIERTIFRDVKIPFSEEDGLIIGLSKKGSKFRVGNVFIIPNDMDMSVEEAENFIRGMLDSEA